MTGLEKDPGSPLFPSALRKTGKLSRRPSARALEDVEKDPPAAVTAAWAILESLCVDRPIATFHSGNTTRKTYIQDSLLALIITSTTHRTFESYE